MSQALQTPVEHMRLQQLWHWQAHWQMAHWYLLVRLTSWRTPATMVWRLFIVCIRAMGTHTLCICSTTRDVRASVLAAVDNHAPAATPQADSTWQHAGCPAANLQSRSSGPSLQTAMAHIRICNIATLASVLAERVVVLVGCVESWLMSVAMLWPCLIVCMVVMSTHVLYTCISNTCGACKCACST